MGPVSVFRSVSEAPRSDLETTIFSRAAFETNIFLRVQKVTLESAVCGLEGPVDPSAEGSFPVSERF